MRKWRKSLFGLLACLAAALPGCWQEPKPSEDTTPSYRGISLTVGALDEAGLLAGVVSQRGEWVASRGGEIAIREQPVTLESAGEVDVLLFPGDRLGDLIDAGLLAEIPNEAVMPPTARDGLATETDRPTGRRGRRRRRTRSSTWASRRPTATRSPATATSAWHCPTAARRCVLVYRRDAFERDANRAAAAEKGLKLEPPRTWSELDALARFFQGRDWDGDGRPDHGISLVLGADAEGLGNATFLARAASLGQHPDQFSFLFDSEKLAPRIDTEPVRRGPGAADRAEGGGPARDGAVRCRGGARVVPHREGRPADRSRRACGGLVARQAGRRRPAAGLGTGLRPRARRRGSPRRRPTRRAICPTAAAG